MFIAALFKVAKGWKQTKCPANDGWMDKMWHGHMIKYYLAIKRNKVLIHVTKWMNRENTMLSERGQAQKDRYCMITFK